ncbi:hypothetical protein [Sphingobacterium spiritivorum]|uniref:hypothetical protein n=1 Tax=Sphingobacterium spiritivorum TaxID=258 RepID=UPI003DA4680F
MTDKNFKTYSSFQHPLNGKNPQGSPEGWGCPTVSNEAMKIIDARLRRAKKPVLMWIYN